MAATRAVAPRPITLAKEPAQPSPRRWRPIECLHPQLQMKHVSRSRLMLAGLLAVLACSESSSPPGPAAPTTPATETQDPVVQGICRQQTVDASVKRCGDFYSTYPTGFVVDAATDSFDKSGKRIDSCGGNRFFSSDAEREASEQRCATYLVGCTQVVESCRSLR